MDKVFRFSDYEIFAYIGTGFAAMVICDLILDTHWVLAAQWSASELIAVVFSAYVAGHVVAWPAAWVLERRLVRRVLGPPSRALFAEPPTTPLAGFKRRLFPDYFTPLDERTKERVRRKAQKEQQVATAGEGLFWTAFACAKRDPATYARMEAFLKLYGFCRNVAFVGLLGAALVALDALWDWHRFASSADMPRQLFWSLVALLTGVAMLYRYLKFHRLYSVEVFIGYAESGGSEEQVRNAS